MLVVPLVVGRNMVPPLGEVRAQELAWARVGAWGENKGEIGNGKRESERGKNRRDVKKGEVAYHLLHPQAKQGIHLSSSPLLLIRQTRKRPPRHPLRLRLGTRRSRRAPRYRRLRLPRLCRGRIHLLLLLLRVRVLAPRMDTDTGMDTGMDMSHH